MNGRDHITWKQIGLGYLVVLLILTAMPVALLFSTGAVGRMGSDLLGVAIVVTLLTLGSILRPIARWFWRVYLQLNPDLERRTKIGATGFLCVLSLVTTAAVVATSLRLNF